VRTSGTLLIHSLLGNRSSPPTVFLMITLLLDVIEFAYLGSLIDANNDISVEIKKKEFYWLIKDSTD